MSRLAGMIVAIVAGAASNAGACGFHNYTPQPTLVDRLIDSEHVVLARQNPDNPFRYQVTSTLEGDAEDVELPHLVDSITRKRLGTDPAAQVLFARQSAYGPWQRVAFVDEDMRPVLNTVMSQLPDWRLGEDLSRFRTFAAYLDHPDEDIRLLALRELDRADYGFLVSHDLRIDMARVLAGYNNPAQRDLRAIRILLLGLGGRDDVRGQLALGLDRAAQFASSLTGAYATALIELDGPAAANTLAQTYLTDPELPEASREALVEALALHGQYGDQRMQNSVAEAVTQALRGSATLAPAVARQFGARQVWSQRDALSDLVRDGALASPLDVLAVSQYVAMADGLADPSRPAESGNSQSRGFD